MKSITDQKMNEQQYDAKMINEERKKISFSIELIQGK